MFCFVLFSYKKKKQHLNGKEKGHELDRCEGGVKLEISITMGPNAD